jgi:uncharacterized membrane protein
MMKDDRQNVHMADDPEELKARIKQLERELELTGLSQQLHVFLRSEVAAAFRLFAIVIVLCIAIAAVAGLFNFQSGLSKLFVWWTLAVLGLIFLLMLVQLSFLLNRKLSIKAEMSKARSRFEALIGEKEQTPDDNKKSGMR